MNIKLIGILGISSLLAMGCTSETAEERFTEAQKEFDNNAYSVSIIALKSIISEKPSFLQARILLADAYLKSGQELNAKRELTRILQNTTGLNGRTLEGVVERYLLISFLNQDYDDIQSFDSNFPTLSSSNVKTLVYRFKLFIDESRVQRYGKSGPQDPLSQALHQLQVSASKGAVTPLKVVELIEQEQNSAYLPFLAHYFLVNKDYENCISTFNSFEERQYQHPFTSLRLAQCYFQNKQYAESLAYADEILKGFPDQPLANKIAGTVHFLNKDIEKAEPYLTKAVAANRNDNAAKMYLSTIYLQQGYYEKAYQHLKGADTIYPKGHPARQFLAIAEMEIGEFEEGLSELLSSPAADNREDLALLAIAAGVARKQGGDAAQAKLVEKMAMSEATSTVMEAEKLTLINQLRTSNNTLDFSFIPDKAPSNRLLADIMIGMLFRYKDAARLHGISQTWAEDDADSANFAKAVALYLESNYADATTYFSEVSNNKSLLLDTLYAETLVKTDKVDQAISLLEQRITQLSEPTLLLSQLFSINRSNQRPQDFVYSTLKTLVSSSVNHYLLQAKFHMLEDNFDAAKKSLKKFKSNTEQLSASYWKLNLKNKILSEQQEDVLTAFDEWIQDFPKDAAPVMAKISYLESVGEIDAAHELAIYGSKKFDDDRLRLLDVNFLVLKNNYESAQIKFKTIDEAFQATALGREIRATFALHNKDFRGAENILRQAYKEVPRPRNASMMFSALMHQNKTDEATEFLEKHLSSLPSDLINMRLLADTLLETDLKKSRGYYIYMLNAMPTNHQLMNNLAWIENQLGHKENAKTLISKAIELQPENSDYQDTFATIYK